ncbi:phosphoribosylformylglycinamidine synthase subunit PurS [Kozakia baliensis]|uniref:Phosphoribosylformylglycinamidine synthase subunit PurS n=1 Tax=Kozakia baliensis TaxID=153496 RepID=A0A1D8UTE6_9PROT|nr:phosphoribosylformylglycinamidine synthase subunit PurS [Kozakia baliensis]AOX16876.1 phosphoribosylformylglycinamidine synthase [Kozakia baliensis]AOX19824.1 phosphoribosylformylglycinamidine synthase [Kozakia baliensis]GBR24554.1 phosphoribosyl formylglycinamidine synthase [Kozakia baliensis NRIC 0488]GEL64777.1 phosphoribosylformylglycinamidine synthase subunit PurS [Kozakia baliensis]
MKVRVNVVLKEGVLDPQGKAIGHALDVLGFHGLGEVRVGKTIEVDVPTENEEAAVAQGEAMARALLANLVIEDFSAEVVA